MIPHTALERDMTGLLLDCVDDAIVVLDAEMEVRYANSAATKLASRGDTPTGDALSAERLVHIDDSEAAAEAFARAIKFGKSTVRLRLILADGERPVEITLADHLSEPGIAGVVACFRNLEREEALRASLERQRQLDRNINRALTDQLTGLPSRRMLLQRLDKSLQHPCATDVPVALFFIDLDGFKAINDTLGHSAGDTMLRVTASRLLEAHDEIHNWGRIGGNEFALFVEACGEEQAVQVAGRLSTALRQPIMIGNTLLDTSATVGVTVVKQSEQDAEAALRQAGIALCEGKRQGADTITLFTPDMERRVVTRAEIKGQLQATLIGSGPNVVFQPIVDLRSGHTVAVEALARWHSPTHGPIGPDRFVPMAEQMGIVDQLDRHVLRKACRAIRSMRDPFSGRLLDLTVNASTQHLADARFAEQVADLLRDEQFPAERLILEVTESIAVPNEVNLCDQLRKLRHMGVRIAVDDFGTGHSSLAQLEKLPVDIVKVDRSFLEGIPMSRRRLKFVETIIAMANALDLTVVFEGIEDLTQAQALVEMGVVLGQGYLMSEPTPQHQLAARIRHAHRLVNAKTEVDVSTQQNSRFVLTETRKNRVSLSSVG